MEEVLGSIPSEALFLPFFGAINQIEREQLTFSMKGDRENVILAVQYRS